jgi:hypothetical protein
MRCGRVQDLSTDCIDDHYVQRRTSMRYTECKVFGPELELSADPTLGDQCLWPRQSMVYGRRSVQSIAGRDIRRRTDQSIDGQNTKRRSYQSIAGRDTQRDGL